MQPWKWPARPKLGDLANIGPSAGASFAVFILLYVAKAISSLRLPQQHLPEDLLDCQAV